MLADAFREEQLFGNEVEHGRCIVKKGSRAVKVSCAGSIVRPIENFVRGLFVYLSRASRGCVRTAVLIPKTMADSFVQIEPHPTVVRPVSRGLFSRIVGVVFSPAGTLAEVAQDPRPVAMIALISTVVAASTAIFLSTGVGKLAWLDEAMRQADVFGLVVSDRQYARLLRMRDYAPYLALVQDLVGIPLLMMGAAGIVKGVFAVGSGARAPFRQILGVIAASGVILTIRQLFVLPLNYARESMTNATNVGVLLPVLPVGSFPVRVLGMIDAFGIWWLLVLAMGLATVYRRPARPIAVTLVVLYGVVAFALALVRLFVGGS